MRKNIGVIALCSVLLQLTPTAQASIEPEKKWDLGIGLGSVYGPDYRGSDEYRNFTSAIPYIVYHGTFIKTDREGVKAEFFSSHNFDFSLSASAYISPDSDKNQRRENMPTLGSTIELGPSLNIRLSGDDLKHGWHIQLPWRLVIAVGGSKNQMIGSVMHPQLVYQNQFSHWSLRYSTGVMFGSTTYHDYYYSVTPQYATAVRPEFTAQSGYSGFTNNVAISRELEIKDITTRFAFFIRHDNLQGVTFNNSPLFVSENVLRYGVAFIWVIH